MVLVAFGNDDFVCRPALREMFRARKQVFADLLKWEVPVIGGEYEVDEFDNEKAIYIIASSDDGRHMASARLLATTRPHILGNLFADLCQDAVPRGPQTFEITRFCLDRRLSATERRFARNCLVSGIVGFALRHRIRTYTGVAEMAWLQQILAFGWDCRPLGEPRLAGGTLIGALSISISANTPDLLAANGIWVPQALCSPDLPKAA